jgi:ABC-type transport system involved in cytochrome c biogenesis permease subunit
MLRFSRKIFFGLWILLVLTLVTATFVEKYCGNEAARQYVYGSWWFAGLWAALAGCSLYEIRRKNLLKNVPMFLMHISFIVILAGALCTKLWGERGQIVLRQNEPSNLAEGAPLPFHVTLDTFYIQYYAGTGTPSDYVSVLTVRDTISGEIKSGRVSMNKIFSYKNYRFYQSSFTADGGSVLGINHDPCGIALTYAGYALFLISGLWIAFRKLFIRKKSVKNAIILAAILFCPIVSFGQNAENAFPVPDKTQSQQFGNLWMLYKGRISSASAFAQDFTLKLTSKNSFGGMTAEQFLCGFLFFPEQWQNVAIFEIKNPSLKKLLNAENERASFADFFDSDNNYKLSTLRRTKEIERLNDKIQLINLLHSGAPLQLFPLQQRGKLHWYCPTENFQPDENPQNITFIRTVLTDYYSALKREDEAAASAVLQQIVAFQRRHAGESLPSDMYRRAELFYLKHNPVALLFKLNLAVGILCLIVLFGVKHEKWRARLTKLFFVQLVHSFAFLTVSIGLRTYLGGRLPMASGFETMLLLAWLAMLGGWIFRRKNPLATPFGLLISGCALLVAHLSMSNPEITPLVPVLSSPLLSLHVSVIMIAYVLLAFTALNSGAAIIVIAVNRKSVKAAHFLHEAKRNSLLCLRPALYLLGLGIFVGAVWANISWGSYWSWDPKETWALISFMTYSLVLHRQNIPATAFHIFVFASFATILITYFGVNYFFGGLHGYLT